MTNMAGMILCRPMSDKEQPLSQVIARLCRLLRSGLGNQWKQKCKMMKTRRGCPSVTTGCTCHCSYIDAVYIKMKSSPSLQQQHTPSINISQSISFLIRKRSLLIEISVF